MSKGLEQRDASPRKRSTARAVRVVGGSVAVAMAGVALIMGAGESPSPTMLLAGDPVQVSLSNEAVRLEPVVREASAWAVPADVADRNSVEASVAAYMD